MYELSMIGPVGGGRGQHDAFEASRCSEFTCGSETRQRESNLLLLFNVSNIFHDCINLIKPSFTLILGALNFKLHVIKTHYLFFIEHRASGILKF